MRRFLLILLAVLSVLVVGLVIAARVYLRSDSVRHEVATRLETLYGGRVEVEDADIGVLGDSTLNGLRFYEPGTSGEPPLATVGKIKTDVSALDLLRGVMPKDVTLIDPAITLRLDREGHFLTKLPENSKGDTAPTHHPCRRRPGDGAAGRPPRDGRQGNQGRPSPPGRPADAERRREGRSTGASGRSPPVPSDPAAGALRVTLSSNGADVTQDKLLRLPFVPAVVWEEVEARGATTVDFTFRHDPQAREGEQNHYRVELRPRRRGRHAAHDRPVRREGAGRASVSRMNWSRSTRSPAGRWAAGCT